MLEFVAGLFAGNALLVLLAVPFLVDVTLFAFEKYIWSVVVMTAVLVGGYFFVNGIHDAVMAIGWQRLLLFWVPVYLGLGVATAALKWTLLTLRRVALIRESKKEFDKYEANGKAKVAAQVASGILPAVTEELTAEQQLAVAAHRRAQFIAFYSNNMKWDDKHSIQKVDFNSETSVVDALTPRALDNKGLFTLWIYQWPIVLVDVVLQNFLVKLAHNITRLFDFAFSYFSRKLVANATKGL